MLASAAFAGRLDFLLRASEEAIRPTLSVLQLTAIAC